jgi:ribose 5-phosphate isomerase B
MFGMNTIAPTEAATFHIAVGADHAGFQLKDTLVAWMQAQGHAVHDFGTHGPESVDYPDFAHVVCEAVTKGEAQFGVLVCGTGLGMSYAANRHAAIRCAMVSETTSARLARQHNNANVVSMGARMIGVEMAIDILRTFLATGFEGGRHVRRIAKIEVAAPFERQTP